MIRGSLNREVVAGHVTARPQKCRDLRIVADASTVQQNFITFGARVAGDPKAVM